MNKAYFTDLFLNFGLTFRNILSSPTPSDMRPCLALLYFKRVKGQ